MSQVEGSAGRVAPQGDKRLHISLKAGQRIYINGAAIEADRRVGLQLLNGAAFLLDTHVLAARDATTPLRRLYVGIQTLLLSPAMEHDADAVWRRPISALQAAVSGSTLEAGLSEVRCSLEAGHVYDALRALRRLFAAEAELLGGSSQ